MESVITCDDAVVGVGCTGAEGHIIYYLLKLLISSFGTSFRRPSPSSPRMYSHSVQHNQQRYVQQNEKSGREIPESNGHGIHQSIIQGHHGVTEFIERLSQETQHWSSMPQQEKEFMRPQRKERIISRRERAGQTLLTIPFVEIGSSHLVHARISIVVIPLTYFFGRSLHLHIQLY